MLSIGRMGAGQGAYYLEAVARGAEDYYLGAGEAPGRWLGAGATLLGLSGEVGGERFSELFDLSRSGAGLVASDHARRVPGFDLTFSAPKSVSLMWALGGAEIGAGVRAAHEEAVEVALAHLEREAVWVRRGHAGAERLRAAGLVAAAFPHRTSRAGDPAVHTHVLVANVARGPDGRWSALDSRALYAHAQTAGFLYQAHLRHALTRDLGLRFGAVTRGSAEIAGVPAGAIRAFSRRRAEIEAELARRGAAGGAAAEAAALRSRKAKDRSSAPSALLEQWRERARALGVEPEDLRALVGHARVREPDWTPISQALVAPTGLTHALSTFGRREVLRALCAELPAGAPVAELERRADDVLGSEAVVELDRAEERERRWTTRELLGLEQRLVDGALARRRAGVGVVGRAAVHEALRESPGLSAEQARAVTALLSDGDGVAIVVGAAGSGKTRALRTAAAAWAAAGRPVMGAALAARAAQVLEAEAGIPSGTLHALLRSSEAGRLPHGCVVVLDEAGMVGTRQLAALADHVARAEGKLVLVGDPRQLPEIEAGGALSGLARRLGALELTENRRQREPWERAALSLLREGRGDDALGDYAAHGRVHVERTEADARGRMVAGWWTARQSGADAIMIAARRNDVADLNRRARILVRQAGALRGPDMVVGEIALALGDEVVATRNSGSLGVTNGTLGTVVELDDRAGSVTVLDRAGRQIRLPPAYVRAGHLQPGYALTAHKAQGLTVDQAHVLAEEGLHREWGYVALSRGRDANHVYLAAESEHDDRMGLGPEEPRPDPGEVAGRRLRQSRMKSMAIDEPEL